MTNSKLKFCCFCFSYIDGQQMTFNLPFSDSVFWIDEKQTNDNVIKCKMSMIKFR